MKQYRIPIHSFVDVITNSSTEIYTTANEKAAEACRDMINQFLKMAQSDKTADDLFDFAIVPGESILEAAEYEMKELIEEGEPETLENPLVKQYQVVDKLVKASKWDTETYKTAAAHRREILLDALEAELVTVNVDYPSYTYDLVVTSKQDGTQHNMESFFASMFSTEASYN